MIRDGLERRDGAGDGWEGGPRGRGYIDTQSGFPLLCSRNQHAIVKQLYPHQKKNALCNHTTYFAAALTKSLGGPQLAKHEGEWL